MPASPGSIHHERWWQAALFPGRSGSARTASLAGVALTLVSIVSLANEAHPERKRYENRSEVSQVLFDLLNRMVDWLKFAEAKNTGAVGLSSTGLGVIVTFLVAGPPIPVLAGVGLGVGAVALMLSLMLAVASFLPSTNLEKHLAGVREKPSPSDNLFFYDHLARYEPRTLTLEIIERYFEHEGVGSTPSKIALDLAGQIITTARITVRKMELFRYSLLLFGLGVLVAATAMAAAALLV
jgi:hypothetical protein